MAWTIRSEDDRAIIEEISKQTDRGAALIAQAYMEERLTDAIKSRLVRHKDREGELFKGSGALASFSVKIDLGLLLGIYEKDVWRFLRTIRDIRNAFAHQPQPMDFNSQKIKDKAYPLRSGGSRCR